MACTGSQFEIILCDMVRYTQALLALAPYACTHACILVIWLKRDENNHLLVTEMVLTQINQIFVPAQAGEDT